jgi:hypothetical protein
MIYGKLVKPDGMVVDRRMFADLGVMAQANDQEPGQQFGLHWVSADMRTCVNFDRQHDNTANPFNHNPLFLL